MADWQVGFLFLIVLPPNLTYVQLLILQQNSMADFTKKQSEYQSQIEQLKENLKKSQCEVQEVRAQLRLRSEATHRLEQDNVSLRDKLATLQVHVDTTTTERDRLLLKWQLAEVG